MNFPRKYIIGYLVLFVFSIPLFLFFLSKQYMGSFIVSEYSCFWNNQCVFSYTECGYIDGVINKKEERKKEKIFMEKFENRDFSMIGDCSLEIRSYKGYKKRCIQNKCAYKFPEE